MSACKSCGAAILWAKTLQGKAIPLDPTPRDDGNIVVIEGTAHVVNPRAELAPLLAFSPRHVSHFVTCPQANGHRKARAR